jgi:hypothetical protein
MPLATAVRVPDLRHTPRSLTGPRLTETPADCIYRAVEAGGSAVGLSLVFLCQFTSLHVRSAG